MTSHRRWGGFRQQPGLPWLLFFLVTWTACDEQIHLLNLDRLSAFLALTPSQAEAVTEKVGRILAEIEAYLLTVRESRRRTDEQALVESARRRAEDSIRQITQEIRDLLTPEQQRQFDRVVLPDMTGSPQTLELMVLRARRERVGAIRVKPVAHVRPSRPDSSGDTYEALKERWTIVFGPGGFNTALQTFPILVTATLLDSALVEAEIRHTASPDSLDGPAGLARRQAYYQAHRVGDMLTIRMVWSTFLHESYLDPGRWIIYLEDDQRNQHEPAEVLVDTGRISPQPSPLVPRAYRAEGGVELARRARQIELRFPRRDALGAPLIQPQTRALKLVLFEKNDPASRTAGEWVFQ